VDEDDFDLGGFDEAYSPDDFSQADMDFATNVGQQTGGFGDDNTAQEIANYLAQPQLGTSPRSNIVGSSTYDPTFAAAFDISRGLDPTNNMGGTGGLAVPSYLRPQVPGNKVLNEAGDRMMYGSPVERFFQENLTDAIRSAQESGIGITGLLSKGFDTIKSVFDGVSFLNDSKAGKTVEEEANDQKRIEIADLEKNRLDPLQTDMTDPSFMARPIDTVTKTPLDKLRAPLSGPPRFIEFSRAPARTITPDGLGLEEVTGRLDYPGFENDRDTSALVVAGTNLSPNQFRNANIPPTPVMVNPIQRDIAKSRGIFDLPQAADLQKNQIAAGANKGTNLAFDPFSSPENFQRAKESGIINEFGLTATEQANLSDIFRKEGEEKRKADEVRRQISQSIDTTGLASIPVIQQKYADVQKEISNLTAKGPVAEGTPEYNKALKLAEKEDELRNIIELQNRVGPRQNLFSDIVNLAPNPRGEGFVLENKAVSGETITEEKVDNIIKEYADVGINLSSGEASAILSARDPMGKIGVNFRQLPPNLQEQFFLNTNLDYGRSIPTPINVVY